MLAVSHSELALYSLAALLLAAFGAVGSRKYPQLPLFAVITVFASGTAIRDALVSPRAVAWISTVCAILYVLPLLRLDVRRIGQFEFSDLGIRYIAIVGTLVFVLGVGVVRGALHYGIQQSLREAFVWFTLLAFVLGIILRGIGIPMQQLRSVWTITAMAITMLGLVGWWRTGFAPIQIKVYEDSAALDSRPIYSSGALIIAQVAILSAAALKRSLITWVAMGMSLATVVLTQQRTVWIAAAAGLVIVVLSKVRGLARSGSISLVLLTATSIYLLIPGSRLGSILGATSREATSPASSLQWRLDGWRDLLTEHPSMLDWVIGRDFGAGYSRAVEGQMVDASPHSTYVELLLRFGIIGLVAFLALWAIVIARAESISRSVGIQRAGVVGLVVSQIIFAMTYRIDVCQGLLLGILISCAGAIRPSAADTRRHRRQHEGESSGYDRSLVDVS